MTKPTPHELVKLYYRIGEVSQIVGVQPHVLRYWETEFRTIRPQKSTKGQRVYSRRDVERLMQVKDLLKNQGFTIAGARKQLSSTSNPKPISVAPQAQLSVVTRAAEELRPPPPAASPSKTIRKALVALRAELCEMLAELEREDGRPDS